MMKTKKKMMTLKNDSKENFTRLVNARRVQFGGRTRRPRRKAPVWLHPSSIIRSYASTLSKYMSSLESHINNILLPDLQRLIDVRKQSLSTDSMRHDAFSDEFKGLYQVLVLAFAGENFKPEAMAAAVGPKVIEWNDKEWKKQAKFALGVDIFTQNPESEILLNEFIANNSALVSKTSSTLLADIQTTVTRSIQQGKSYIQLTKEIERLMDISKNRARLIARDQIGKFNGQLSEYKQKQAGIESYVWRDVDDSRVRPEHAARDGQTYSWSNPPYDGHPGQPVQCRCFAEPVWEPIFKELGMEE